MAGLYHLAASVLSPELQPWLGTLAYVPYNCVRGAQTLGAWFSLDTRIDERCVTVGAKRKLSTSTVPLLWYCCGTVLTLC